MLLRIVAITSLLETITYATCTEKHSTEEERGILDARELKGQNTFDKCRLYFMQRARIKAVYYDNAEQKCFYMVHKRFVKIENLDATLFFSIRRCPDKYSCSYTPCWPGGTCVDLYGGGVRCDCRPAFTGTFCKYAANCTEKNSTQKERGILGATELKGQNTFAKCRLYFMQRARVKAVYYDSASQKCYYVLKERFIQIENLDATLLSSTLRCPDKYSCSYNPCSSGSTCVNRYAGGVRCDCLPGFTGSFCESAFTPTMTTTTATTAMSSTTEPESMTAANLTTTSSPMWKSKAVVAAAAVGTVAVLGAGAAAITVAGAGATSSAASTVATTATQARFGALGEYLWDGALTGLEKGADVFMNKKEDEEEESQEDSVLGVNVETWV